MKLIVGKCYKATNEYDYREYWSVQDACHEPIEYFYGTPFIVLNFEYTDYVFEIKMFYCNKILFAQFDSRSFKFEEL